MSDIQAAFGAPRERTGQRAALEAAWEVRFTIDDLAWLRGQVSRWAREHSMDEDRTQELVLAMNELASNSVAYGGGEGTLAFWREGQTLLCEVRDGGHIQDPDVGARRPAMGAFGGWGLWLAKQLCDHVQIRTAPGATAVRIQKRLA